MSHPRELIERIRKLLLNDYPGDEYQYALEKALPGTHMFPDIAVKDFSGRIVCAVEIGYTRPEKLTAYRLKHKIPDVRWYDKTGKLHQDILEPVVRMRLELEPRQVAVTTLCAETHCESEECLSYVTRIGKAIDRWEQRPIHTKAGALRRKVIVASLMEIESKALEEAEEAVYTYVAFDEIKAFAISLCDNCGASWIEDGSELEWLLDGHGDDLRPDPGAAREDHLLEEHKCLPWADFVKWSNEQFGLDLDYTRHGVFWDPEVASRVRTQLSFARRGIKIQSSIDPQKNRPQTEWTTESNLSGVKT